MFDKEDFKENDFRMLIADLTAVVENEDKDMKQYLISYVVITLGCGKKLLSDTGDIDDDVVRFLEVHINRLLKTLDSNWQDAVRDALEM